MKPARWLALGDSYTIGEGVEPHERWPARLAAAGLGLPEPRIVATTGWTTDELLAGMEAAGVWPATEHHELVTLLIGVNDQYRGRTFADGAYARCAERAVTLAGGEPARVLGLSIPDWGVTRFAAGRDRAAIATAIDDWNAHERAHLAALGAHWCDLTALSRRHGDAERYRAADGLHPGAAAYIEWALAAAPQARAALSGRSPDAPRGTAP
ncbi:MAG: GDSL-type esterase/lipase family protein [Candidatus Eisenbacteria bacterium]